MKLKNWLLSCSPGVHRKRLEVSSPENTYANLRPISKRSSVPDFGTSSCSTVNNDRKKAVLKQSNSTSNFHVNSAGVEEELESPQAVTEFISGVPVPKPEKNKGEPEGLKVGERIVWAREETGRNEFGIVRWLGNIQSEPIAGIEFDRPLYLGSGWYENKQLFWCLKHHGGLVAVAGLMLEKDYFSVSSVTEESSEISKENLALLYPPASSTSTSLVTFHPPQILGKADPAIHRFSNLSLNQNMNITWSPMQPTMPRRPFVKEPLKEEDAERFSGRGKGIQGNRNSCYLDATLFSMFSFSSVFDSILVRKYEPNQKLSLEVQKILREDIVNTLRKDLFCPAQNIMRLRETMHHLDNKLTTAEMDPAEFLQILFKNVLRLKEFIKLSSNESDFFHQVLVQASDKDINEVPTIQRLFEQSLIMQELKLMEIPCPVLILQMPRSGNKYKMYSGIFPNLTIDITDLIQNTPRTCVICGKLATVECPDCYDRFTADNAANRAVQGIPIVSGAESTAYCESCIETLHIKSRIVQAHQQHFKQINYNFDTSEYFNTQPMISFNGCTVPTQSSFLNHSDSAIPRITMDLVAVICIETSHFVSFVKCGTERTASWAFFDSMADRVENINGTGQNIPHVKLLPAFGVWLDQLERDPENLKSSLDSLTPEMKRFLADPYICIYYSPQVTMYR